MSTTYIIILIAIYLIGLVIFSLKNYGLANARDFQDIYTESTKRELRYEPLWWPIIVLRNSPWEWLKRVLVGHWSVPSYMYYHRLGLYYAWNDWTQGRNRYKHYQVGKITLKLPSTSRALRKLPYNTATEDHYAEVTFARYQDIYLLHYSISPEQPVFAPVTRFNLDDCVQIDREELEPELAKLSPEAYQAVLAQLDGMVDRS